MLKEYDFERYFKDYDKISDDYVKMYDHHIDKMLSLLRDLKWHSREIIMLRAEIEKLRAEIEKKNQDLEKKNQDLKEIAKLATRSRDAPMSQPRSQIMPRTNERAMAFRFSEAEKAMIDQIREAREGLSQIAVLRNALKLYHRSVFGRRSADTRPIRTRAATRKT
jgi:deoxyadenosine/deoxycytidine kinase